LSNFVPLFDAVLDALGSEGEPHPGLISAHFHISANGTQILNYAEWDDEDAHRDALQNGPTEGTGQTDSPQEAVHHAGPQRDQPDRAFRSPECPYRDDGLAGRGLIAGLRAPSDVRPFRSFSPAFRYFSPAFRYV
jgi:hypothetical protein